MRVIVCCFLVLAAVSASAASTDETLPSVVASLHTARFITLPFLPPCMRVALVQGDPRQGASVELAKMRSGCVIPPLWHAANTRLIFVSGYGVHQTKNGAPTQLRAGDYVYLPAHQVHSFRCISQCIVYNLQDGRDVVHWLDARGKEIRAKDAFPR